MEPILNLCTEIEKTAGQIYQALAVRPTFRRELRETLEEMARDEEDHVRIIQFAKRLDPDQAIQSMHLGREQAKQLLAEAQELLASVRTTRWPEDYAVRTMLAMEDRLRQVHVSCSTQFADASMQAMFAKLGKADEQHVSALRAYL